MKLGFDYYIENGYKVFTKAYHLKRGKCCQNSCRHCPWNFKQRNKMNKEDLFFDMDGVLADFHGKINYCINKFKDTLTEVEGIDLNNPNIFVEGHQDREIIVNTFEPLPGFYRDLLPIEGALEAFKELSKHYNTFILSTASWDNPSCFSDKRLWVEEHLGEHAYKRLILTHHKEHFTGRALIDDRIKNGAADFKGEHIHFRTEKFPDWSTVLKYLLP